MGTFFGYCGSLLILAAAAGVLLRFAEELKLLSKEASLTAVRSLAVSAGAGLVYLAFIAYIKTCLSDPVNMFDIGALFPGSEIREGLLGRIIFGDYAAAAMIVSFFGAWIFVSAFAALCGRFAGKGRKWEAVMFTAALPGFFMMYSPTYFSVTAAAAALAALAVSKRIKTPESGFALPPAVKFAVFSAEVIANALVIYGFAAG